MGWICFWYINLVDLLIFGDCWFLKSDCFDDWLNNWEKLSKSYGMILMKYIVKNNILNNLFSFFLYLFMILIFDIFYEYLKFFILYMVSSLFFNIKIFVKINIFIYFISTAQRIQYNLMFYYYINIIQFIINIIINII